VRLIAIKADADAYQAMRLARRAQWLAILALIVAAVTLVR
jgi:hypothetical protein